MEEFYKRVLENNVTVLFEKREIPVTSVSITVNNGGQFESEDEKGVSHFLEHLVFKGTKKRTSEEIAKEIEKKGGIINAGTSEEFTNFLCKLPSRHLDTGFDILHDIFFNPLFAKETFEKERMVILEEIRMYKDNPMLYVSDKIKRLLYSKPFGLPISGSLESVGKMTREQVVNKYKSNFKNKTIVCVVGKANFGEICRFAERFPVCRKNSLKGYIKKLNHEMIEKRKGIDQAHFIFGYHSPEVNNTGRYLNSLIMVYLAGGMSSILNNEIREKRGLAYVVHPEIEAGKNYGMSSVYVGTEKKNLKKVREIVIDNFKKVSKMPQKDFEQTKEQLIGLKEISQEDSGNVMQALALEEFGAGAEEYYKFEEKIKSLKLEDVKNFKLKGFSSFSLVPD